jgi:hypothetical protein
MLYNIHEEKYPKDEEFLKTINKITINLNSKDNASQCFCLYKGEFINFKKEQKLENLSYFVRIPNKFIYRD